MPATPSRTPFSSRSAAWIGSRATARLSTWLHRIAVNAALDAAADAGNGSARSRSNRCLPTFLDDGHHAERFASWAEPADKILERAENRAIVRRMIGQLPDAYRTVLLLRDIEGLDTEETAKLLETTPNAVKIRLHRARQALRTLLAPHFRRSQT